MRIIAGEAKGKPLRTPRGSAMRPTSQRVRAALLSILGEQVKSGTFLDLYAGTGSVGMEALSRGAPRAVFVEAHGPACRILRQNLAAAGLAGRAQVVCGPVERFLARLPVEKYSVVFLDPPYTGGHVESTLRVLDAWAGVAADTWVVVQHSKHEEVWSRGNRLELTRQERYGETILSFYRMGAGKEATP